MYSSRIEVRFRDCDPMGHVNNAVYFTYLEQARLAAWRDLFGFESAFEIGIILARCECDFRSPATYGDTLDVKMRVSAIGRTSFTCDYELVNLADGRPVATARSVQVMYDYGAAKPVPIPDPLRRMLEQAKDKIAW